MQFILDIQVQPEAELQEGLFQMNFFQDQQS